MYTLPMWICEKGNGACSIRFNEKILTYFSSVLITDHLSSNHSIYETNMPVSGKTL